MCIMHEPHMSHNLVRTSPFYASRLCRTLVPPIPPYLLFWEWHVNKWEGGLKWPRMISNGLRWWKCRSDVKACLAEPRRWFPEKFATKAHFNSKRSPLPKKRGGQLSFCNQLKCSTKIRGVFVMLHVLDTWNVLGDSCLLWLTGKGLTLLSNDTVWKVANPPSSSADEF